MSQAIKTRPRVLRADVGADIIRAGFAWAIRSRLKTRGRDPLLLARPRPHTPIPVQHACLINLQLCTQAPAGALQAIIGAAREDAGPGSLESVARSGLAYGLVFAFREQVIQQLQHAARAAVERDLRQRQVTLAGAGALGDRGLTIDYPQTTQSRVQSHQFLAGSP